MSIAKSAVEKLTQLTNLPPSFDGNPFLYATALTSVMSIACLGLAVTGWMARDTWRDRWCVHPRTLLFSFRLMMGLAGFAAFFRSMPEVLYLQVYGDPDVSSQVQGAIITAKRVADSLALWLVLAWMLILVTIYPHICLVLKHGTVRQIKLDTLATWPRLVRPAGVFLVILVVAAAFAYGKVYTQ
jgi:hypothetical protein